MNINVRQFHGPLDWDYIKQRLPLKRVEDTCGYIAYDMLSEKNVGAVMFDNFLANSCQVSLILDSPMVLRHGFFEHCFDFVFNNLKLEYLYCMIADNNVRSKRMANKYSFKEKARLIGGYGEGVDFIVYELCKSDCAWLTKYEETCNAG